MFYKKIDAEISVDVSKDTVSPHKPLIVILFVFMPLGSLHLFTIQIHYLIQNTQ